MVASANPNRVSAEPSFDAAAGRTTYVISKLYKFFYWAILDAISGAGLAREVIMKVLLSI